MALTVVVGATDQRDRPLGVDADDGRLGGGHPGRLDVGTDADPAVDAVSAIGWLPVAKALVVGHLEGPVERRRVIAAVVDGADGRLEGEGPRVDEVAPAERDRVEVELGRRPFDEAFDDVGRLGPAGSSIGVHR